MMDGKGVAASLDSAQLDTSLSDQVILRIFTHLVFLSVAGICNILTRQCPSLSH
jgi:hypothetical protein